MILTFGAIFTLIFLIDTGSHGCSPLHLAAENGHLAVCEYFLKIVIEKNPPNQYGKTPYHYAKNNGHQAICDLISEKTGISHSNLEEPKREDQVIKFEANLERLDYIKPRDEKKSAKYRKYRRFN